MHDTVLLAHGSGGTQTQELIEQIFARRFANPYLTSDDAAILSLGEKTIAVSTDGFIVHPHIFPGGDIGKLSICGTVNDISCMGAKPMWLTCSFVLEEGLPMAELETIVSSMAQTANTAKVNIVAGDTKVAGKGQVDKIFINTTGIGIRMDGVKPAGTMAREGDAIIVSGDIGRHGCAILLAREHFNITTDIQSDCAPLWHLVEAAFNICTDIHVIRDATRGGVGTVLYEIARQSQVGILLKSQNIPVDPKVSGVCQMLGLDPLYLACEGRLVFIVPQNVADSIVASLRSQPHGESAAIIGHVTAQKPGSVFIETSIGSTTLLPKPTGELLPRIC
ncbi:MAG: hydrogenase expression/formation protein HypE [Desulfovibrio sp.]|nr:hydrogenase expression/formation protein HypE [Desulfovibrio sp.]